jgi:hypothetical protein
MAATWLLTHQMREAIRRRDDGDETLADIGRSHKRFALHDFEASGMTVILHRTPRRTCAGFTSSDVQSDLKLYRMTE